MNTPKDTKPFNLEHAKAGAPYECRDGREATILKWDCRDPSFPLVGVIGPKDCSNEWRADGRNNDLNYVEGADLVMLPLGYIDGKPVFVGDKLIDVSDGSTVRAGALWSDMNPALWRWPAPAKQYPVTKITEEQVAKLWSETCYGHRGLLEIANAALRHAIDAGQVVAAADVEIQKSNAYLEGGRAILGSKGEADRAARDMAIAKAVHDAALYSVVEDDRYASKDRLRRFDLATIIAQVKP